MLTTRRGFNAALLTGAACALSPIPASAADEFINVLPINRY